MVIDLRGKLFVLVYCILIILTYIWYRKSKKTSCKYWVYALFVFYLLYLIRLAFLPLYFNIDGSFSDIAASRSEGKVFMQLVPFKAITDMLDGPFWFRQIVGNIAFLFPLPIFIGLFQYQRPMKSLKLIIIGVSFSLFIEITQYILNKITSFPNNVTDIDDLILNSFGVILGVIILSILIKTSYFKYWLEN